MNIPIEVIFVDDEEHLRIAATQTLELAGYTVRTFSSAEKVLETISRNLRAIIVTDIRMPGMDGISLLRKSIAIDPELPVVLVTGHGDINLAVASMREGAYDFIEKPFTTERLLDSIGRALEKRQLTLENRKLRESVTNRPDDIELRLVGRSPSMCNTRVQIRAAAATPSDVLIVGDSGTGKEIAARAIHDFSSDDERPFVVINCAALPVDLIETELFGYEAGAFPGAIRPRFGKLEHGRNGTIFLDQAHALTPEAQAKFLRVCQERTITRIGGSDPIDLNCRFIAAASIDLENNQIPVSEGQVFSTELLYRLNAITLRLPPLSSRMEDIPMLFAQLADEAAVRFRRELRPPPDELIAKLMNHDWPGNVRELRNVAERFVLGLDDNRFALGTGDKSEDASLRHRVAAFERETIATELRAHNGNLKAVYQALGLSRKTLYEKMQKYDLERTDFRTSKN